MIDISLPADILCLLAFAALVVLGIPILAFGLLLWAVWAIRWPDAWLPLRGRHLKHFLTGMLVLTLAGYYGWLWWKLSNVSFC